MIRSPLLLALAVTALAAPATAAETPHAHGGMGGDRTAQTELGASATFDTHGVLWAVHKVSGHIAVSRSTDQGRSWQNPVLVTPAPEPTDSGADARPKIALGTGGEIYVTWTKPLEKPFTGEIRFSRSLDGGRTFSPPLVVHHDGQIITHRFDTLAVNRRGQIFIAWIDKRDLATAAGANSAYRGAAVYFAVSDDRGAGFRGDFKVADHACECCRIALVATQDGSVGAVWRHIFAPNIRDHAAATLFPDGRVSEVRRASFEDWRIDACPHHGPAVAVDAAGRLHAVWFSAAPNHRGVFYGRLQDNSVDGLRRVGGDSAAHADIAVEGHDVALAWKAYEHGRSWLRGSLSSDGGATWRDFDLKSTPGASDYPRVLWYEGQFRVFWNTSETPLAIVAFPHAAE
jgi:hypothetical protein